jgi:ABC-type nitrate/sulfonate/bicarbonate transport system substrate-binding protein
MMAKVGIPTDQDEIIFLPSDINHSATGKVPVWARFINAFVLEVQRAGSEINIIAPDDYGIHFYGDVLITTDEFIAENSDVVQGFINATLKGWKYVVEKPQSAGPFVQVYIQGADAALEIGKMIKSNPLTNRGEDSIGWMKPEPWKVMEQTLREQGVLTQQMEIDQVYTTQFQRAIYNQ